MNPLAHIKPTLKTGDEPLLLDNQSLSFTLLDFWRWSASDILSNATRGRLAEFLVATATGIDVCEVREEWGAFDLTTPCGVKLEIKSAAYLQSWEQYVVSKIKFSIKPGRAWDWEVDKRSEVAKRHADVYVFCLLKHDDKKTVNPLEVNQWDFYVMSTHELDSKDSISLKSLQRLTQSVCYNKLDRAITSKRTS